MNDKVLGEGVPSRIIKTELHEERHLAFALSPHPLPTWNLNWMSGATAPILQP